METNVADDRDSWGANVVPSWVVPVFRWQEASKSDDIFARLVQAGTHLITFEPAPSQPTLTHCFKLGTEYWIWQPDVGGAVFTDDPPELLLRPLVGRSRARFETTVWRSWLPAIYPIWQRQVIHASAVASPAGDVIVFTGPSGACKSTTAYGMARRKKWTLVSDDALAFSCPQDSSHESIRLHPLRRVARLRQATARYFGRSRASEVPFEWPHVPLQLKAVYALDASSDLSTTVNFSPLGAAERFPLLLAQAFAMKIGRASCRERV